MINRPYKLYPYQADIVNRYSGGEKVSQIAEYYVCYPQSIRECLKRHGYEFSRRKYSLNQNYFDEIDTEEKAYFLGFLYADGNHTRTYKKRTIRLELKDTDIEILYKLNNLLQPTKPITRCAGKACIEIVSDRISDKMMAYGMMPAKTFKLTFPAWLDNSLYNHFIRGYLDGDGYIAKAKRKKPTHSPAWRVGFVGTLDFCSSVRDIIKKECQVNFYLGTRHPERNHNIRHIESGGRNQVQRILEYIYKDATIYLNRKYLLYKEFIDAIPCVARF